MNIQDYNIKVSKETRDARCNETRQYELALKKYKPYQQAIVQRRKAERRRSAAISKLKARHRELTRSLIAGGPTAELAEKIFKLQDAVRTASH